MQSNRAMRLHLSEAIFLASSIVFSGILTWVILAARQHSPERFFIIV